MLYVAVYDTVRSYVLAGISCQVAPSRKLRQARPRAVREMGSANMLSPTPSKVHLYVADLVGLLGASSPAGRAGHGTRESN